MDDATVGGQVENVLELVVVFIDNDHSNNNTTIGSHV